MPSPPSTAPLKPAKCWWTSEPPASIEARGISWPVCPTPCARKPSKLIAKEHYAGFERLTDFIEDGRLVPVIERTYPLTDTREAMRHLETGQARGKLVVTVGSDHP